MSGYLTTHVLDTATGSPAADLQIDLFRIDGDRRDHLATSSTNEDGRTDEPVLPASDFFTGTYELVFHAGAYLRQGGMIDANRQFLDIIPIRFKMSEPAHFHVPLLLSPYGYTTYRGS